MARFQQPPAGERPAQPPESAHAEASTIYTAVDPKALPGWNEDLVIQALPALKRSCAIHNNASEQTIGTGPIARPRQAWVSACQAVTQADADADLRAALAQNFTPYRVAVSGMEGGAPDEMGMFTGYYEAELSGSLTRGGKFQTPIYGPPRNLVSVSMKDFLPPNTQLPSYLPSSLVGRLVAEDKSAPQLKPYYSRAEIDNDGAITDSADILAWAEDPVAVHILHIQGSGRMTLPDGQVLRLGFAGHNGRAFRALGAILRQAGVMQTASLSMITVREWLHKHPDQAGELMSRNARYIFFQKPDPSLTDDGPIGAQNVALTAGRSLAVDPRFVPLGAPIWVDTRDPEGALFRRLMVSQDTGAAITGPVRGDIFWGHGEDAFLKAGRMRSQGGYFIFVPKAVPG